MGSKSALLRGALGSKLLSLSLESARFVDLFSGSAAVAHFAAENMDIPVLAYDLQKYSQVLGSAILERVARSELDLEWLELARADVAADPRVDVAREFSTVSSVGDVLSARSLCERGTKDDSGFVWRHYGGHYFSPYQSLVIDHLLDRLPDDGKSRSVALSAVIHAASSCSASPGHTAQPLQPKASSLFHIQAAWKRDPLQQSAVRQSEISRRFARRLGRAEVMSAASAIPSLVDSDLVFCDPPYSAVQYSRFYHVLEGVARGGWSEVSGAGRAPRLGDRAVSDFSRKGAAYNAFESLLSDLRETRASVALTFPSGVASNGISGRMVFDLAYPMFDVEVTEVDHVHSLLGGSGLDHSGKSSGRRSLRESLFVLKPK